MTEETIRVLRETLALTPDNLPLRKHLASLLRAAGRLSEAAEEYRAALKQKNEPDSKLALAEIYYAENQTSHAIVVLESLATDPHTPAGAMVLLARCRLKEGEVEAAVSSYQQALDLDPSSADPVLSEQLGVSPQESAGAGESTGEISGGRIRFGGPTEDEEVDEEELDARRIVERPKIRFDDVGGMDSVKEEIDLKIIQPLKNPDLYKAYGKEIGGGILLYGPPGCGKTHLARATAGQVDASFQAIGLNEVLSMWIGESERNLHALFDRARRDTPFVLFFDEVDALGANRSDLKTNSMRMVINQFLEELDGANASNDGVLILAATNAPWHLDPAFRRPGRFDRILFVPPPDDVARAAILEVLLKDKPTESLDLKKLASKTDGFSGADLKGLIDHAIEDKLRDALKTGRPAPIVTKDLLKAAKKVKPSTREWFSTARNYVLYSNEGGLYDDVARYMKM